MLTGECISDNAASLRLRARVASRRSEADGIVSLDLVPDGMTEFPRFTPGSHIQVEVAPGLVRHYSLCNSPADANRYRIAVLREVNSRGGSAAVHERFGVGDVIRISEPKNLFELASSAPHSRLVAGGIGVTPLLSMAQHLYASAQSFELHYFARSLERMAFRDFIVSSGFAASARLHFTRGKQPRALDLDLLLHDPQQGTHLYVCGPAGFIDAVLAGARARGWPDEQIHREYFAADPAANSSDSTAFRVRIASTGEEYEIPADRSVAAVLTDAGVVIPTFCEQGTCGTCLTRVLAGIPEHRDVILTEEERARGDQFTPCCSRSKSALLVLDL